MVVSEIPLRPVNLGTSKVELEHRADGSMIMRALEPLGPYPRCLTECLVHWAEHAPDRVFIAERTAADDGSEGWTPLTYADALDRVRRVGQALLDRGLDQQRPVMILADNSIDNAIMALACLHVGVPSIPVNPAYALLASDFSRLDHHIALCQPHLVYCNDGRRFEKAANAAFADIEMVVSRDPPVSRPVTLFADLLATTPTPAVDEAFAAITPDTLGKIMFTSGTVGTAKGVMYHQQMLCANRQQHLQQMPFLAEEPPVLVEWLPWHHTFGGTANLGFILYVGGSLYIDPGKPVPGEIEKSISALTSMSPTLFNATPATLAALFPYLRSDPAFSRSFFRNLKLVHYGGAAMSIHVREEFYRLAAAEIGQRVILSSGIGSTETGPIATGIQAESPEATAIGVPVSGSEVKLVPAEDGRYELRHRGLNVTRGYYRDEGRTREAFDEEGFYRTGDAVRLIDPEQPQLGLVFEGRLSENFKIANSTWVNTAAIREEILAACAPCLADVVLVGESRDFVAALLFPDWIRLSQQLGEIGEGAARATHPKVGAWFQAALDRMPARSVSQGIRRAVIEAEPLSLASGELTAKMSVSANRVRACRAASIARLYADEPGEAVICLPSQR